MLESASIEIDILSRLPYLPEGGRRGRRGGLQRQYGQVVIITLGQDFRWIVAFWDTEGAPLFWLLKEHPCLELSMPYVSTLIGRRLSEITNNQSVLSPRNAQ